MGSLMGLLVTISIPRWAYTKYGKVRIVEYAGNNFWDVICADDSRRRILLNSVDFRKR